MKRLLMTVVLTVGVALAGRAAQAPPNLSGTWRPTINPAGLRATDPFEVTITQSADSVTLHIPLQTPDVTLRTDGTPAANGAKGMWEGSKFAITTTATGRGGAPTVTKQTY